jgi:hypothetical protein
MPAAFVSVIFQVTPTLQILLLFSDFDENQLLICVAILEWWDGSTGTQLIKRV